MSENGTKGGISMKKRLAMGGVVGVLLALLAFGTVAYFTTSGYTTNVITTGTVQMTLTETGEGTPTEFDEAGNILAMSFENVMPGQEVNKVPVITNTGTADFYLRVKVSVSVEPKESTVGLDASPISTDMDRQVWLSDNDGWLYYPVAVKPGEKVTLFEKVKFDKTMGDPYQGCTVEMKIEAQAVQSKNNPVPENGSVLDVKGWPGTALPEESPQPTVTPTAPAGGEG